jgi:hypothetical protein
MSVAQAFVYSTKYDKSMNDPFIQHFITLLIILFTSASILNMPDTSKGQIFRLLKTTNFSMDSKHQIAPNGIYRNFLMKLMEMVEKNTLTREQLEFLFSNLFTIEQEGITGFIPYPSNHTKFISNSHIREVIQNKIKDYDTPSASLPPNSNTRNRNTTASKKRKILTPCQYGPTCYRQQNPSHTAEYSHPGNNNTNKGGKRKSKKVNRCVRQTLKKYRSESVV